MDYATTMHWLRLTLYWVTVASVLAAVGYTFSVEVRDALIAGDQALATKKAIGGAFGIAFLIFLLVNPFE